LAQSATNKKMLRQPSLRFAAMTGRNWRRTAARTRGFVGARSLKRLQVLEQFLFVLVRQLRPVDVAFVAVAFLSRVEKEVRLRHFAGRPGWPERRLFESNFDWIEDVVTAMKSLRTFIWRIQQIAQRRNGAVMKVRRTQPDSV